MSTITMDWKAAVAAQVISPLATNACRGAIMAIMSLATTTTEYQSNTNKQATNQVLDSLATRSWWLGKTTFADGRQVPEFAIGIGFFAYTSTSIIERKEVLTVSVTTPKWRKPLISDAAATRKDHLVVLEQAHTDGWSYWTPVKVPLMVRKMDDAILARSEMIVDRMIEAVRDTNTNAFVITGPPGTGKSFSARLLAFKMEAALIIDFDPRKSKDCIKHISNVSVTDRIVIVLDECDVIFLTMDKAARNAFLDVINSNPQRFILVMTTNVLLETMWEKDASLMRSGRMEKMEITENGSLTHVSDDMLKDRVERMQAAAVQPQRRNIFRKIFRL